MIYIDKIRAHNLVYLKSFTGRLANCLSAE